mmetsp:Transcript_19938/g.30184  ORF Transcript_19938/g.30184 Transcript_19938/m.30184 type:complete len:95 (+) Transcript_19938:105-389(+)
MLLSSKSEMDSCRQGMEEIVRQNVRFELNKYKDLNGEVVSEKVWNQRNDTNYIMKTQAATYIESNKDLIHFHSSATAMVLAQEHMRRLVIIRSA